MYITLDKVGNCKIELFVTDINSVYKEHRFCFINLIILR